MEPPAVAIARRVETAQPATAPLVVEIVRPVVMAPRAAMVTATCRAEETIPLAAITRRVAGMAQPVAATARRVEETGPPVAVTAPLAVAIARQAVETARPRVVEMVRPVVTVRRAEEMEPPVVVTVRPVVTALRAAAAARR